MRTNAFRCLTLLALLTVTWAHAAVNVAGIPLRLSVDGNVGYSSASVPDGYSHPSMIAFGFGGTALYNFTDVWMAGITSDISWANQYSDTNASGSNFRGHRWNIVSPTFGAKWMNATILGDFQFLGNYSLYLKGNQGGDVSFTGPIGGRLRATYPVFDSVEAGLLFQYVTFGTLHNSVTGDTSLASRQKLWQLGLTASYVF
jgi:hypothetical protein